MQNELNDHPEDVLEKELILNHLEACLEKLQDKQKKVIEYFYLEGKCYAEISQLTNEEAGIVRSQIQNGRRNLRICMDSKKDK